MSRTLLVVLALACCAASIPGAHGQGFLAQLLGELDKHISLALNKLEPAVHKVR